MFPSLTLQPGEVVVVFNGYKSTWTGPVGDTTHAPDSGNDRFAAARVLSMNVDSAKLGFSNKADYILLTSPEGQFVECIKWGDIKAPDHVKLLETAPDTERGSVMRRTIDGALEPHPALEGKRFSPGKFPLDAPVPNPPASGPGITPAPTPPPTPRIDPTRPPDPPKPRTTKKKPH